jgi:hypothetical protein
MLNSFKIIQKVIESSPQNCVFWITILKNYWFCYFYPAIFSQVLSHKDYPPTELGFHPCPPSVHVQIANQI